MFNIEMTTGGEPIIESTPKKAKHLSVPYALNQNLRTKNTFG